MYLIDTNVVSEVRKQNADPRVDSWWRENVSQSHFSVVTLAEMRLGISLLKSGRSRHELEAWFNRFRNVHAESILAIDEDVALIWGEFLAESGADISARDSLLAATARAYGLTVATRDEGPFKHTGITTVNPWKG